MSHATPGSQLPPEPRLTHLDRFRGCSALIEELRSEHLELLEEVASEATYQAEEVILAEGEFADRFLLIDRGRVGLEAEAPGRAPFVVHTLGRGDLVGVSWMFPPHRWAWTARAAVQTTAVVFDALQVRARCETDADLRLKLLEFVGRSAIRRMQAARLQLLNLYETSRATS